MTKLIYQKDSYLKTFTATVTRVREDGWMGAGICRTQSRVLKRDAPLALRYLLHAHGGQYDHDRATSIAGAFAKRPRLVVSKSTVKHQHHVVARETS